jgi:tetratricopeptide (TPR) repeat protein
MGAGVRGLAMLALLGVTALGAWAGGVGLWAGYHFRAAHAALERHHDNDAVRHLKACLTVWPDDPQTLLMAARAARRQGAFVDAEAFLDRYRQARGGEDDDVILEDMLLLAHRGEVDRPQRFCQTLVAEDHPEAPSILEAMANGYLRQLRLGDALACLKDWEKRQPRSAQLFFLRGKVYDQQVNMREALTCYRRAVQLDARHDDARLHLAGKLLELAQADEALPHLKYLATRLPDSALVALLMARCRSLLGEPAVAARLLDDLLRRVPNDGLALTERGSLALQGGQPVVAERLLRRAAAVSPGSYQAYHLWYQALVQTEQTDEARKAQEHMTRMKEDMKRIQEIAIVKMQQSPHDPALHYEAGTIALRAGALDEGVRWLRSALKENRDYLPAHEALAEFFERAGSPGLAVQHRQAIEAARERSSPQAGAKATP